MSIYRVTEIIGTSPTSWEEAAREALSVAARTLRDLRVAEVAEQDIAIDEKGGIQQFRVKLRVSFKYEVPWTAAELHAQGAAERVPAL
jgi:flavin-binding protein dodecin